MDNQRQPRVVVNPVRTRLGNPELTYSHDAAKEPNLPSGGLPRPAGFDDTAWSANEARSEPPIGNRTLGIGRGVF